MSRHRALLLLLLLAPAAPLRAQDVRTAVLPEAITVGDVFHAAIRVTGAGEGGLAFPDSLALPAELESAGRRELRRDTVDGRLVWTALYPLAGWRPGEYRIPPAEVRLATGGGGTMTAAAAPFPPFTIRSVLPADTSGIEPKPASDVLGSARVWWPILVLLVLLALLAAALLWWYRRRRARAPAPLPQVPAVPPREAALAALDAARRSGALEAGELKTFYSAVSEALRAYLEAVDAQFGMELTTTELTQALRSAGREQGTAELRRVLESADLVKFARRRPSAATAEAEWLEARRWVERFEPDVPAAARAA